MEKYIPKWLRELNTFMGVKPGIILDGNVYDEYITYSKDRNGDLFYDDIDDLDVVISSIVGEEYNCIFFDPILGFYCNAASVDEQKRIMEPYLENYKMVEGFKNHGLNVCLMPHGKEKEHNNNENPKDFIYMSEIVRRGLSENIEFQNEEFDKKVIFVINFASRLQECNVGTKESNDMFINLMQGICSVQNDRLNCNSLVMLTDGYDHIPTWFYLNNPSIRTITITAPDRETKRTFVANLLEPYTAYRNLSDDNNEVGSQFFAETEGLKLKEIMQIFAIAEKKNYTPEEISLAFRLYKYGIKDSPWDKLGDDIMKRVDKELSRVKGQEEALKKVKTVVSRSINGLSGIQDSGARHKPKGVLFFAGPTGVGKTETAKALARAIFGDENACVRFDMSEYREAHSEEKLFGAPPGYVGFEGGGQLTNAIKERPFSILLFDEIEKAHPTILDKFLQILEDGRMTDGQGNTVYFGETLIIFTSNIGLTKEEFEPDDIYKQRPKRVPTIKIVDPNVPDDKDFKEKVDEIISTGVKDYFIDIGRPELLNRLGEDNIVVFQFIDKIFAEQICENKVKFVINRVKDVANIEISLSDKGMSYLKNKAVQDRNNGGRGVGNMIEREFVNKFSNYLTNNGKSERKIVCDLSSDSYENGLIFRESL